jgi:hypothetical protein
MTLQAQPSTVEFLSPEGFCESYTAQAKAKSRTIFIARPDANANGSCSYLVTDDHVRAYLPNTVRLFLSDLSITTVTYEDSMYGSQDKLLVSFTSVGGDSFCFRTGLLSFAASSLVLGLCHLNSVALTGEIEITWVAKGACVFARVATAVNGGYVPVELPKQALGHKLTFDEMQDGLTFINQSIAKGDAIPPNFFGQVAEPEVEPEELDSILDQIRKPSRSRSKSAATAAVEAPVA